MNGLQATSSPSSSPSLTADAGTSSAGRKRQRSQSMESAGSSSSPKRAASEDAQAQDREEAAMSLPTPSGSDIDAYMATQEDDPPLDSAIDPSATPPQSRSAQVAPNPSMPPTPEAKLAIIEQAKSRPLTVGETWYLVSRAWYRRWHKAVSGVVDKEGSVNESDLGPVDNSALVNSQGIFSVPAVGGVDVEYLPQNAWDLLVSWYVLTRIRSSSFALHLLSMSRYGQPTHTLARKVIPRGISKEPSIELFPPRFRVYRLFDDSSATLTSGSTELSVEGSEAQLVKDLLPTLARTADPSTSEDYRVWKVQQTEPDDGDEFPKGKLVDLGAQILEFSDKTLSDALIDSEHSFIVQFKKDGAWVMDVPPAKALHGNGPDTSSSLFHPAQPLFGQSADFFSRLAQSRPTMIVNGVPASSALLKPAVPISSTVRKKPAQAPGLLGLGNM